MLIPQIAINIGSSRNLEIHLRDQTQVIQMAMSFHYGRISIAKTFESVSLSSSSLQCLGQRLKQAQS